MLIKSQYIRYYSVIVMENVIQQTNRREEGKILKVVDRVLKQVFGKEATHLIYTYLESNYSVKKNEIAEKIDVFAKGLEEFLSSGACVIERIILDDIYSSYGLLRRLELERTQEYDFVSQMRLLTQKA
jgi:hypothetical protein